MSATQTEPAVRVAVLPFRVSGPNATAQAWMGDAAAMETTALLSKQQGVSVLERREVTALVSEIQRGSDPTRMATTGRLVGAERLILGELVEAGAGQVRVFIRPVRVEDGRVFDVQSALLDVDDWLDGLEDVIEELGAKAFGGSPAQLADGKPLSPAALQLAARARGLSARGELMAALPLYEKALVERSNAWDVEADYAVLLNDLNMFDVAAARAQETLDRMPLAPALGCARTRLQAEFARGRLDFSEAREAVRLSAACGDKVVQARALTNYGRMATWVDYPLALAAFERAGRLLGPSGNGWQRCVLRFNQRDAVVVQGLDEGTAPREAWEEIARECESAGNDYFASQAWEKASEHSFIEADRSGALERAAVDAQKCGGMRLVKARLALAEHQRRLGKPSEADATLLAALGEWLGRIAARNGGLPALERELDRDLLERAGLAQAKPAPKEPLSGDLFVAAERLALATVLREWARQTENSSQRQAAVYRKLADRLAGSPASVADTSLGRLEQALAQERTSLVALEQAQVAPLRGSFYLANVEVALDERFWESLDDGTSPEEISRIQAAHAKVAGWHQAPKALVDQSRYQAERAAREGKSDDALAAVRSARTRLTRDAWYEDWLASAEDAATEDESAVASLREAQLGLARRLGASAWLNQLYYNASERARHDARACESGRADLLAAEKALAEQKAWGEAIEAYDKAIRLERLCDGGRAGPGSLELARERAKLLDSLGDPLRHLEGVVGLLREKSDLQMYPDAEELALATSLADGARELFRSGRPRDAARVAAEAEMRTAGEMWLEALDWTKSLSDSAEYPWIRGQLHHGLSSWVQDPRLSTKHLEKARLSYLAGGHRFQAALTAKQQMSSVGVSITRYDKCVALSVDDSELCVEGYVGATEEAWPIDAALARHVLEHAKRVIPNDDWAADYLARMESAAASVALRVGDRDYFETMRAGAQPFLADPARHAVGWWNFLGSAANSSLHVDEGLAFQLAQEALALDLQGGARSYALWRWMGHADSHGRGALADRLQAQGLAGSKAWKHRFTLRGVRQLVARGEYEEAAKRYRRAIETTVETGVAQREQGEYFLLRASLAQALALRGDLSGAEKELVSLTHDVAQTSAEARPICLESAVLDVAASVASARKDCARAESLRAASELQAAACRGAATHVEGWAFADEPELLGFRSDAACGGPFAPHERLFAGPGPSPEEARRMSQLACERGVRKSCDVLPMVEGKPELLEEACQQGWGRPCATRAEQLVKTEPARALGLAHEACERDWAAGCVLEATGLAEGWGGTPVQPQSSLRKLDRACELGQLEACALYIERGGKFLGDP